MSLIEKSDLHSLRLVVDEIFMNLASSRGNPDPSKNFSKNQALFRGEKLSLARAPGHFSDLKNYRADDGIKLSLPVGGYAQPKDTAGPQFFRPKACVFGILCHELRHVEQRTFQSEDYAAGIDKTRQIIQDHSRHADIDGGRWLSEYYDVPVEMEAHTTHMAAEIWLNKSIGDNQAPASLQDMMRQTEVYSRMTERLGDLINNPNLEIAAYFERFTIEVRLELKKWNTETD